MHPISHFALGFICGILLTILFRIYRRKNNCILKSGFFVESQIIGLVCGLISVAPDYGQLWGNNSTDETWWAFFCFGHRFIDNYLHNLSNENAVTAFWSGAILMIWASVEVWILYKYVFFKEKIS